MWLKLSLLDFQQALIPKLRDQDPNVVISVLAAIGEHAQVVSFCSIHVHVIKQLINEGNLL